MKYLIRCFVSLMLAFTFEVGAASSETRVRLYGHVPEKAVSEAIFLKHLDAPTPISFTFTLPLRNKKALEELIQRIYDPMDQQHYGKYLTPEEFTKRFAPTQADYDRLISYAKSIGLTITGTHANRILLNVSGRAESIEAAFDLRLNSYQKSTGQMFYAPNNDPEVPSFVASIIQGIVGLDNQAVWRAHHRRNAGEVVISSRASNTYPSGPGGAFAPNDIQTAYNLLGMSGNGSGQIVALFELGPYLASDITAYTNYFNLPPAKLQNILVDGGPIDPIDPEVALDIELVLALAPQSQIYVYEGPNAAQGVLDTYNRIALDNLAKQISTSWGIGENVVNSLYLQVENTIFQQMAAQGQTIYAASGDMGAYDDYPSSALVVDDPASQPYMVGVGGTKLTVDSSSGAYGGETIWNEGLGNGAGGGGVSVVWPIPSWQTDVSTAFSKTYRNVPDVSLNADPNTGYSIYYNGQWTIYGGTSCAAPLWAAFTALVNQKRLANGLPVLGFANPILYGIGIGSSYITNFHDITMGNNYYYAAGMGYDNASGWGSFNGDNLYDTLVTSAPGPGPASPNLGLTMKNMAPSACGATNVYEIVVYNIGSAPTSSAVNVSITLPQGLTYRSLCGSGWTFDKTTLTCTENNVLNADSSYPPITLILNVAPGASAIPIVTVSGGS